MAEENENVSKGEPTSIDNIAPKVTVNPITGLPFGGGTINPETNQPDKNPITGKKFGLGLLDSKGQSNFGNYKSTHSTLGGKGFSPSNIFTDTYSMYNMEPMENYKKYGVTMGRNFDFDEIRARNQSNGETIMRGIGGALVTFGGALLENTIGFFAGLGEMATGGAYYDNAIGKSVDKMNAWVDEYAPIYKTKEEEKYSTWQKMGTAHFWADDVLGGAAYTAAAAASMYLTGGGGLMTKGLKTVATRAALYNTTKAVINGTQIAKNVGQGANISNRLWQASQVLEAGAMMSLAEASVEARETQKSTYDTLVENYLEQHKTADINNIPKDKLKEFEDISYSAGNTNFVMQMPVLMGTNLLMFGRSVSGFKVGSSINKDVIWDSATKSYVSKFAGDGFMASTLAKLKPFAQQGLNEAFQEAYQFGSSAYASSYHIDKYENNGNGDISKSLAAGWDAINTQEGFESALIGFITGGIFGGAGAIKAKQYSTNVERADRLAGVLNGGTLINAAASYQSANAVDKASKEMEAHLKNGDIKKYQDARFKLIAAQSMEMLERGGLELYIEQLEESSNFADPEFKKLYGYLETDKHGAPISIEKQSDGKNKHEVIDSVVKKVRQFEKTFNNVNERFPLPDRTTGLPRLLMSTEERNAEDQVYNDRANLRNELIFSAAGIKDRNRRMSNIQKTIQSEVDEVQSSFRDSLGGRSVMFGVSENLSNILSEQQPGNKGIKTWKEPGTREAQQAFVDEAVGVDEQGNKIYTAGAEIDPNVRIEDQNIAVQPDRYDAETQYEETKLKLEELIFQVGQRDALAAEKIAELSGDYLSLLGTNKVSIEAYNKLASDKYAQEQWTNALNKNIEDKVQQNADKEGLRIAQEAKTSKEIYDNLTVSVSPAVLPQIRERIEQLKKDETEARNKYLNQVKTLNPKDKVEALKEIDKEGLTDSEKEGLRLALDQAQVALTKDKLQNPSDEVTEEDVEVKEVKEEIEEAFAPENVGGVESISENGREFQIEGKQYYNREANPQDAIVTDAKGDLVSIKLQTEDGVTESFRAPKARIEALHVAILASEQYKVDSAQDIARQDILNRAGVVLEESKNELAVSIKDNTKDSSSLRSEIYGLERSIDEVLEVIDELRTSLIQDDNATKKDINANSTIKELNKRLKQIKAAITKRRNVLLNRNESSTPTIAEITAVEQKVLNDVKKLEDKIKDLEAQALEVENTLRRTESQMEDYQNDPASFAQVAKENADAITKSNNIEEKQKTFYTLIDYKKQKLRRLQNEKQNRPANPAEQTTPEAPGEIEKPATEGENPNITTVPKEERVTIAANLGYQRVNSNSYVMKFLPEENQYEPGQSFFIRIKDATDVNIPGYSEVEAFTYKDQNGITNVVDSLTGRILGRNKVAKLASKQAVETLNQNTPTEFFKNVINENEKTSPAYEPTNVAEEAENFTPSEQRTQKVITLENGKISIIEAGNEKGPGQRGGMVVMTQAEVEEHDRQVSKNLSEVISEAAEQEIDEDKPYGNTQSIRELVDSANRDIDGIGENFLTYEEGERQLQEIIDLIDKRVRMNQILLDKGKEAYSADKVIEEVMAKHNRSAILREAQIGQVAALKRYIKRKINPTQPTTAAPAAQQSSEVKEGASVSVEDVVGPNTFTHKTPNLKGILNWLKAGKVIGRNESIENFKKEGSQGVFNTDKSNSNVPNFQKGEFYLKNPTSGYAVITNQSEDNFIPNSNGVNQNSFKDSRGVGILKPTEQARNLNNFDIYKVNKDGSLSKIDIKSLAPQTSEVKEEIKKSEYEVHVTGDMLSGWDVSTTVFNVPGIKINDLRSKTTAEGKNGRLFTESVQNNKKVFTLTDASIYRGSRPAGISASMVFDENTTRTLESVEGNLTAIMDNLMGVIKKGSASFTPTNINFDWKKLDVKEIATPSVTMQDSEKDSAQTPIVKTIMPTVFTKDARNNPDTFKPWFIDTVSDSADNKKIYKEISNLVKIGKNLDNKITTWSLGDLRANIDGRPMVSIDIPETGESFIMYKSTGTGSGANSKGLWTPIPGFAKNGWFVKQIWNGGNPKITKYNIKAFQEIHNWLSIPGVSDSFGLEPGSKVVDSTLPSSFSMSLTVGMAATTKFKTKPGEKFQSYIPVNSEGLPIPHNPDTVNGEIIEIDKSPLLSPDIINKEVEFEIIRNDWFKKESANSTKPIHSYVPIYFKIDGKRVGKLKTGNTEDRKVIVEKLNAGEKVVSTVDTVRASNFNAAKTEDGKPWFSNPNAIGMEDVVLLFTDMDMTNGVSTVKWTAGENLNKDADGPSSDILAINREKANINSGQVGILIKDKYNPGGADRVTPGSTQFLTNKAIEAVVTNLIDKNHKIASQIVANSSEKMRSTSVSDTFLEFLTNDKQVKTMVYKSPSTNKLIRINEHELSKALSGKSYIKDVVEPTGADELSLEYTAIPQDQLTNKDIDLNVKEDFKNFLDLKKYHIDMNFGNSVGVYTSPVTNNKYKNYNEYLFSEQEIGEERADGSGHNSIFATDLVQIDGSFFHNPQVRFTKGDVNGNTAETIKADTEAKSKIKPAEKTELDNLIDEMGLLGEDTVPDCS